MASEQGRSVQDLDVDVDKLYREEVFTDLGAASVRRLTPVKADGSDDPERPVLFLGDTQIMTQMGALPLQFPLDAATLEALKSTRARTLFLDNVKTLSTTEAVALAEGRGA